MPPAVSAFPSTVFDTELEAVMLAQEADTEILPRIKPANEVVPFTFAMDPAGGLFSYATSPGAIYAGKPVSLAATGSYDPVSHVGSWTSSAALGSLTWTGTGSLAPDPSDPTAQDVSFNTSSFSGVDPIFDYAAIKIFISSGATTVSFGTDVYTINFIPVGFSIDFDFIRPAVPPGNRDWNTDQRAQTGPGFPGFQLVSNGTVDASGRGTFDMAVVPEPASLGLLLIGLAALVGNAWGRHRSAEIDWPRARFRGPLRQV